MGFQSLPSHLSSDNSSWLGERGSSCILIFNFNLIFNPQDLIFLFIFTKSFLSASSMTSSFLPVLLQEALVIHAVIMHFHLKLFLTSFMFYLYFSILSSLSDFLSFSCKSLCLAGTDISPRFVIMIITVPLGGGLASLKLPTSSLFPVYFPLRLL